eukprot:3195748-Pyramimonas_sp.AAC.1
MTPYSRFLTEGVQHNETVLKTWQGFLTTGALNVGILATSILAAEGGIIKDTVNKRNTTHSLLKSSLLTYP